LKNKRCLFPAFFDKESKCLETGDLIFLAKGVNNINSGPAPLGVIIFVANSEQNKQGAVHESLTGEKFW
jgi:hypothetical protein